MINSMAFEGDGCFLCKPAVKAVNELKEVSFFCRKFLIFLTSHMCRNCLASPHQSCSHTFHFTGDLMLSAPNLTKLLRKKKKLFSEKGLSFSINRTAIWVIFSIFLNTLTQVGMYQQWEQPASPSSDPAQISIVRFSQKHGWLLSMIPNLSGHTHHGCNTSHGKGQTALP